MTTLFMYVTTIESLNLIRYKLSEKMPLNVLPIKWLWYLEIRPRSPTQVITSEIIIM